MPTTSTTIASRFLRCSLRCALHCAFRCALHSLAPSPAQPLQALPSLQALHGRTDRRLALASRQTGFTLIELMVTVLIGLLLTLAVLIVQANASRTNMQLTDAGQRNDQVRSALDSLQRDLGNSLYMLVGTTPTCDATLQYGGGTSTAPVVALYGVAGQRQPVALPSSTAVNDALLKPDAFDASAGNISDMLSITLVPSALREPPAADAPPPYKTVHNAVTRAPSGYSAVNNGWLPLNNAQGIRQGDAMTVFMRLSDQQACLRFTVDAIDTVTLPAPASGTVGVVKLPASGKFADFTRALREVGLLGLHESLTNGQLIGAKVRNDGPANDQNSAQRLVYYVAKVSNGAGGSVPVLVRATINADGALAAQPAPVAAGVVSLQALFGVDGTNAAAALTGGVTNYRTWQQVLDNRLSARVRTVLYAVVARTLQTHPDNPEVQQVDIPSPQLAAGDPTFTPFRPRDATEQRDRYSVYTAEVALRNQLWGR